MPDKPRTTVKFKPIILWVIEWFHESSGEWVPIEGNTSFRQTQAKMRKWRSDTKAIKMRDKFRMLKYVRGE